MSNEEIPPHDIEKKKTVREVIFKLTDEELLIKAREASDLRVLKSSIEEEFSRVKSRYKGQIDDADQQVSELLAIVRSGNEKRIVDVEDHYDYTAGIVFTMHKDMQIQQRLMTNDERQIGLVFVDKRAAKEAAEASGNA